jgi:hypothetical protein
MSAQSQAIPCGRAVYRSPNDWCRFSWFGARPHARYSSAVHSGAKAGCFGGLITRHIIWAAAIATVARITTVRMLDIFHGTNQVRHRVERPRNVATVGVSFMPSLILRSYSLPVSSVPALEQAALVGGAICCEG